MLEREGHREVDGRVDERACGREPHVCDVPGGHLEAGRLRRCQLGHLAARPVPDLHADRRRGLGHRRVDQPVEDERLGEDGQETGRTGVGDDKLVQVKVESEPEAAERAGHAVALDSSDGGACKIEVWEWQVQVDEACTLGHGHYQRVGEAVNGGGLYQGGVRFEYRIDDAAGVTWLKNR